MADRIGRCANVGNCKKADAHELIPVAAGVEFRCPECGQELTAIAQRKSSPVALIVGGVTIGAICAIGGCIMFANHGGGAAKTPTPTATSSPTGGPGPATGPSSVHSDGIPGLSTDQRYLYERSLQSWMNPFKEDEKAASGGADHMHADAMGSREAFQKILAEEEKAVLWTPADTYWTSRLSHEWAKKPGPLPPVFPAADSVKVLVSTKIVLVMRQDRAAVFASAMRLPKYNGKTWLLLSDIATQGWKSVNGQAGWGKLKLVHSNPLQSSSGSMALALMLAEYRNAHPDATADSPGFLAFESTIEHSVTTFPDTTSRAVDALTGADSTNAADVGIMYEQNAIGLVDKDPSFHVIYPSPTTTANFPIALLSAPWVTPEQQKDAENVRGYLLSDSVQKQLITKGFRLEGDRFRDDVDTMLSTQTRKDAGLRLSVQVLEPPADVETINSLQFLWSKNFQP